MHSILSLIRLYKLSNNPISSVFSDVKIRHIKKCVLFGESQTISAAGSPAGDMSSSAQPILESYPFIGQRVEVTTGLNLIEQSNIRQSLLTG